MEYCGKCYYGAISYPFGYCEPCWIKAGQPVRMDGTSDGRLWFYDSE